ncbi:hypothetical protein BKE38_03215 [Pseudoroseomonas deserti]|uniref:Uncharacterized protein n=1 Tax=Teichococcus deserti TaxID=1817963 RepID=A0A1V2H932_9PROT|nr:hypothetical protein [Pseudoroseomonas deserti]ONG58274.1 hypothetical protein BKE38_03215 [Pseudoroseomonas deserti]
MQLSSLPEFLARHGPLPARWPVEHRAGALALLARDPAARALQLQAALAASLPPASPEALARMRAGVADRIARMPLPARQSWPARWLRPLLPAGFGAAAALLACALWLQFPAANPWGTDPWSAAADQSELLAPRLVVALALGDSE